MGISLLFRAQFNLQTTCSYTKKVEDIIKSIIHSLDACECEWGVDLSEEKEWIKNRTLNIKD